ncbi:copper-exporting P-type ATPase A [archaeon BMS3Bbin16]|nr:copper-exporting P-type ATPase A [archaeon BMS3Bbin16]
MMEGMETIEIEVKDYMSPECTCKIEEIAKSVAHVMDASFNPVTNLLTVKAHSGMVKSKDIIKRFKECGIACREGRTLNEKVSDEHKGMKMKGEGMAPGHDHHAMMEAEMKKRFFATVLLSIPVLLLSPTIQKWFSFTIPRFPGYDFVLFGFATAVVGYGGIVFFRGARKSLRNKVADMSVLVSLAVLSGYFYSVGSTFLFNAPDFYWEISTLVVFLLFGHWMEMKAVRSASGALRELVKLIPPTASLVKDGEITEIQTSDVKVGDVLLIRPGNKVPIDGVVVEGETSINESMITGESKPVHKKKGDEVIGGTINGAGSIKIRINKTGEKTALAQIIKLVQETAASKPRVQKLADRAAHYLTLTAIFVGGSAFVYWWGIAGATTLFAVTLTITVLVIACPHALGLAIPTVTSIATTLGAKNGMLVKNAEALELSKEIQAIVFDKTGTLTKGEFGVTDLVNTGNWSDDELLKVAAAVEVNSEHVIAKGVVNKAKEQDIKLPTVSKFEALPGKGAKAVVDGVEVFIGNLALMKDIGADFKEYEPEISRLSSQGKTVIFISTDKGVQGLIALADLIRDESRDAVKALQKMGIEVAMLTGDNRQTAEWVSKELGLDTFFAEVLPHQKSEKVKELQRQGKKVAMVGDGINDAPALIQADVGIAIGTGTDVAIESADVVLIKNDPRDVVKLIRLSKATMKKMKENLVWATGYNALAIPVAAGVLFPFGILLRPELAALIMAGSSIIVVTNAVLLKREKL